MPQSRAHVSKRRSPSESNDGQDGCFPASSPTPPGLSPLPLKLNRLCQSREQPLFLGSGRSHSRNRLATSIAVRAEKQTATGATGQTRGSKAADGKVSGALDHGCAASDGLVRGGTVSIPRAGESSVVQSLDPTGRLCHRCGGRFRDFDLD